METDDLVIRIAQRAANADTRTDCGGGVPPSVGPVARVDDLEEWERELGFKCCPLLRRLLLEVGNGGYGPGCGLIGLPGGTLDSDGRSAFALRAFLNDEDGLKVLPYSALPLCDWGDGIWSCLDLESGHVLTLDDSGLTVTDKTFESWMAAWAQGEPLFEQMFDWDVIHVTDPRTGRASMVRTPSRAKGRPWSDPGA